MLFAYPTSVEANGSLYSVYSTNYYSNIKLAITELPSRDQHRRLIEQGISFVPGRAGQKCLIDDYKRIGSLWLILTCSLYCVDDADASASRPKMELRWERTSLVQEEERQPEVSHYSDQEREGGLVS